MRKRLLPFITIVLLAILVTVPLYKASAHTTHPTANTVAQSDATCKDQDFIKALGDDINSLNEQVTKQDTKTELGALAAMYLISQTRHKYEDNGEVPTECKSAQYAMIFWLANWSDIYLPAIGTMIDEKNKDEYAKIATDQKDRLDQLGTLLKKLIGADVTEPVPTEESSQ